MGMAGTKRGACPPITYSFFMNFNEEALLKFSLKNIHCFQSYKTPLFQNCPKKLTKVEKFNFIFIFGNNFIELSNGVLHVLILEVSDKLKETGLYLVERTHTVKISYST